MFAGKNLRMARKSFTRWFNDLKFWRGVLKIDACMATKHKITLSWPKERLKILQNSQENTCALIINLITLYWMNGE